MKSINSCLATILIAGAVPGFSAAPEARIVAQDLQKLRVAGKVSAVVWTRRNDSYTLQVVLQMPVEYMVAEKVAAQRAARGLAAAPPAVPKLPQVQAWLLKLDGTLVARAQGSQAFPAVARASDGIPLEVMYSFPQSAAQGAVAVAIMVDGVYNIEPLQPVGS